MNKIEVNEKLCFGGSERELAFFGNNLLVTICGNHLHIYDTISGSSTIQKVDFGSISPFTIIGLYQTSNDKNGLLLISCWIRKSHQTFLLEVSPYNFYINSKLEFNGKLVSLSFSNDGKNVSVILIRRKSVMIEIWDREHSLKLSETSCDISHNKMFQVVFTSNSTNFALLSSKKLQFYFCDYDGLKLVSTVQVPNEMIEFSCLCLCNTLIVGTDDGQIFECNETNGIISTLKIGEVLFSNSILSQSLVLSVNCLKISSNFFFCSAGQYIIQWRISANSINWKNYTFYKISPIAEVTWLGISDTETNFVSATSGGDVFENVIIKEADLTQKDIAFDENFRLITSWHKNIVIECCFVAHKPWIISFSNDGKIVCNNFVTKQTIFSFFSEDFKNYNALSLQPFGNHCLFNNDNEYTLALISNDSLIPVYKQIVEDILQCKFGTFGNSFVCLCKEKLILFSSLTFEEKWVMHNVNNNSKTKISFSNTDLIIFLISDNDVIAVSNIGDIQWTWRNISVHIVDDVVGKNDSLFILSVDNCVRELKNGELVSTISFKQNRLSSIAYSSLNDTIVLGSENGEILCFLNGDVVGATSNPIFSITSDKIEKIHASSYCTVFMTVTEDFSITIWCFTHELDLSNFYFSHVTDIICCRNGYLQNEKEVFRLKLRQLQDSIQNTEFVLNSKIKMHLDELNQMKHQYTNATVTYESVINSLKKEIILLKDELTTVSNDITAKYELKMVEKGDDHSTMITNYVLKMDAMETKYKKLLDDFDQNREEEKEKYENKIAELTTHIHKLEKISHDEIKQLRKQLNHSENEVERIQLVHENEIRILKTSKSNQLKVQKENAKTERIRFEIEIGKLKDEILLLEYNKSKAIDDLKLMKTKFDNLQNVLLEKDKTLNQKNIDENKMIDGNKTLKTKLNKVLAENEQMKFIYEEKLSLKEKEFSNLKHSKEAIENEAMKTKDAHSSLTKDYEEKTRINEELLCKLRANQKLLRSQVFEMSHKDKQITLLKQQIVELKDLSFLDQKEFKTKAAAYYQNLDKS